MFRMFQFEPIAERRQVIEISGYFRLFRLCRFPAHVRAERATAGETAPGGVPFPYSL